MNITNASNSSVSAGWSRNLPRSTRRRLMAIWRLSSLILGLKRRNLGVGALTFGGARVRMSGGSGTMGGSTPAPFLDLPALVGGAGMASVLAIGLAATPAHAQTFDGLCIAAGTGEPVPTQDNDTIAAPSGQIVCGADAEATGDGAIAIGVGATAVTNGIAVGTASAAVAEGSTAFGAQAVTAGENSTAIGRGAKTAAVATNSIAIGAAAEAAERRSTAVGNTSKASAVGATAVGNTNTASANNATAIGSENTASGLQSTALGYRSKATTDYAVAVGVNSTASGNRSVALGESALAAGSNTVALGASAGIGSASTSNAQIAIGAQSGQRVNGVNNIAMGYQTGRDIGAFGVSSQTGNNNIALGTRSGQSVQGSRNVVSGWESGQTVSGNDNLVVGSQAGNNVSGSFNSASGYYSGTGVTGNYNVASGSSAGANVTGSNNVAIGHRAGTLSNVLESPINAQPIVVDDTMLSASNTVALGTQAVATADSGTAIGNASRASGTDAVAIGTNALAQGKQSIAIGTGNQVTGAHSGAIGDPNTITGSASYALGNDNNIAADNAFVVGNDVTVAAGLAGAVALGNASTVAASTPTASAIIAGTTYNFAGGAPAAGGVVSVGAAGAERQIQNVAAGQVSATSTDAINGSQLFASNQAIEATAAAANAAVKYDWTDTDGDGVVDPGETVNHNSVSLAGGAGGTTIRNVAAGVADTDAVNVGQLNAAKTHYYSVRSDATAAGSNYDNSGALGTNSMAAGANAATTATATNGTAVGASSLASATGATALGYSSAASGANSISLGDSTAAAADSIAAGSGASVSATAANGTAIGHNATVTGALGVAIGTQISSAATTAGSQSVGIGAGARARGTNAIALGTYSVAGNNSVALGNGADATQVGTIAIGETAYAGVDAIHIGNSTVNGNRSNHTGAFRRGTTLIGDSANSQGLYSVVVGNSNNLLVNQNITASGLFGQQFVAQGAFSNIFGAYNTVGTRGTSTTDVTTNNRTFSGVAVTVAGSANNVQDSNGALVAGYGNTITKSYDDQINVSGILEALNPNAIADLIRDSDTELGQVGVIGAGNTLDNGKNALVMGMRNDVSNATMTQVTGFEQNADTVANAFISGVKQTVNNSSDVFVAGANSEITNASNVIAMGSDQVVGSAGTTAKDSILLGDRIAFAENEDAQEAVAIGNDTRAASGAVAVGVTAQALGEKSIAVGYDAIATGSVAMGASARAGNGGAAFGDGSNATYLGGITDPTIVAGAALGKNALADVSGATALGTGSSVTATEGIALGSQSVASVAGGAAGYNPTGATTAQINAIQATNSTNLGAVSVGTGAAGGNRQIVNVAAGTNDSDAVNVAQLSAVANTANAASDTAVKYDWNNADMDGVVDAGEVNYNSVTLAGGAGGTMITNVADGAVTAMSSDAVNGSQLYEVSQSVATNLGGGSVVNVDGTVGAPSYVIHNAGSTTTTNTYNNVGDALTALDQGVVNNTTAINNIQNGGGIKYFRANSTLADSQAVGTDSVAIGPDAVAVNAGDVALGSGSTTAAAVQTSGTTIAGMDYVFAGTTPTSTVSVGAVGAERTVTNVAAGQVTASSTDAVNGSQLFATNQAIGAVAQTVGNTDQAAVKYDWNDADMDGVVDAGEVNYNSVTLAGGAGGTTITNVAPGQIANGSMDAVNGGQLFETNTNVTNLTNNVANGAIGPLQQTGTANQLALVAPGGTGAAPGAAQQLTNVAAGVNATDAVNVSQLQSAVGSVSIGFTANAGDPVIRGSGQVLAIQGEATSAGSYSGGNLRTQTDVVTGAVNIQMADSPQFGNVIVNAGGTGKITGVTAATLSSTSTDAVNGSQLVALGNSMASTLSPGSTYDPVTNMINAQIVVGGTTYSSVQSAIAAMSGSGGSGWHVVTGALGSGVSSGSGSAQVLPGATTTITAGNNLKVHQNGTEVHLSVNPNLTNMESIAFVGGPTINSDGIDMGGDRITNVGAGVAPTDAVNVGQLSAGLADTLTQSNQYTDSAIAGVRFDLSQFRREANGGTASAMAMGTVPQAFEPGMGIMGVGMAHWQGEQAVAIGFSKASDNGRVIVKASGTYNTRRQAGAAVGMGFQF